TADASGDNTNYSRRVLKEGRLTCLYGDDASALFQPYRNDSVARPYQYVTGAIGFRPVFHEGKVTGLAAHGRPILAEAFAARFKVAEDGDISSDFTSDAELRTFFTEACRGHAREDCAASIQAFAETVIMASVTRVLEHAKVRNLGVAGGLFANVKLN